MTTLVTYLNEEHDVAVRTTLSTYQSHSTLRSDSTTCSAVDAVRYIFSNTGSTSMPVRASFYGSQTSTVQVEFVKITVSLLRLPYALK